jgi:hypothetical protein
MGNSTTQAKRHVKSEAQKEYQRQIERAEGTYIIVRTFKDFYNWFNNEVYGK